MKTALILFTNLILFQFIAQVDYYDYVNYKGDTIRLEVIQEPTICDCNDIDWRNKEQKKICNLTYDYDFMSEEEQQAYDKQLYICKYPSICDCANADQKDKGLLKACNRLYNYKHISSEQLKKNLEELKKCPKKKDSNFSICDCINVDDYRLKKKCNDTFFNDSLISEADRKKNLAQLKKCVEKQSYELEVTTCDCALYGDTDKEYKAICDEKLNEKKKNKRELTQYLYDLKICKESAILDEYLERKKISASDYKYTVCRCNEDDVSKEVIEKCNQIWVFDEMNKTEQKAFSNTVSKCKK